MHNKDNSEADLRKKSLIYPTSISNSYTHTFFHLSDQVFFCSSWKMHYILLRQLLLELWMTSLWLNSKVTLPIWTILIYKLVLSLWMTLLFLYLLAQTDGFPNPAVKWFSSNFSDRMSWVNFLTALLFVRWRSSNRGHCLTLALKYLSLISGVLFWHEIPFKGDSAIEDEGQVSFPSKEKMEGNNTLVWAAEGVWLLWVSNLC